MSKSERPEGLPPQAVWPPRVKFDASPVTYGDASMVAKPNVPEGGFGVRVGTMPMSGDTPRKDGTSEMPTEGPGVARRAIPAPEEAGTTGTIPPPEPLTIGGEHPPESTTTDASPRVKSESFGRRASKRAGRKGSK
jgi:hypothetical protein